MSDIELTVISLDTMAEVTTTPAANDLVLIQVLGPPAQTCVMRWSNLWSLLSGGRAFGGSNSGDVVTVGATQILSGKRINLLKLNSDAQILATGEDLNKMAGIQELTKEDLIALVGSAGATTIASRLGQLRVDVDGITDYLDGDLYNQLQDIGEEMIRVPLVYTSEVGIGPGVTLHTINEAAIVSALGMAVGTKLNHICDVSFGQTIGSYATHESNITGCKVYKQVTGGVTHLDRIELTVVSEKLYWFRIGVHRI